VFGEPEAIYENFNNSFFAPYAALSVFHGHTKESVPIFIHIADGWNVEKLTKCDESVKSVNSFEKCRPESP